MLTSTKNGIEDVEPTRVGAETVVAARGRALALEVRRIRDNSTDPDMRILADAILFLATR